MAMHSLAWLFDCKQKCHRLIHNFSSQSQAKPVCSYTVQARERMAMVRIIICFIITNEYY